MVPLSELEKGSLQPIFKKELSSAHARMTRLNQSEDFIRIRIRIRKNGIIFIG